jgi:hypothetical protein
VNCRLTVALLLSSPLSSYRLSQDPEDRSHKGLFLSFQSPIEIPGVSNVDFLRLSCNSRRKAQGKDELDPLEFYSYIMPKVRCSKSRAFSTSVMLLPSNIHATVISKPACLLLPGLL